MDENLALLEREYCPVVDAALVSAIYSDFHGQNDALTRAREALEPIKQNALAEQYTDFDPSGSSGQNGAFAVIGSSPDRGEHSTHSGNTPETDATSLSNGVSSLGFGRSGSGSSSPVESSAQMEYYQNLSESAKELRLMETFPTLKQPHVSYILKKCKGDYEKATDELLNHAWFQDMDGVDGEKVMGKGVDSFAVDDAAPRGRKNKAKKGKRYMNLEEYARSSSEPASPTANKWQNASKDIDFISVRVNTPPTTVSSLYHKAGGSVSGTITALLKLDIANDKKALEEEDMRVQTNAIDLATEFSMEPSHALALIHLTHPSSAAAHELAKILTNTDQARSNGGIQLIPHYAPIDLSEPEDTATLYASSLTPSLVPRTSGSLSVARSAAFTQASAAYRRGKSDSLMKAVAGYYGQIGRDADRALKERSAAEADAFVASQSSPTQLDLHGVSVKDATRIARAKVNEWWAGLGERRIRSYAGGRGGVEYRIVTGLGRHSDGGKAKIGPAVGKMLVNEGWNLQVDSGMLVVTGMARKG